jgi:hypothetical protein
MPAMNKLVRTTLAVVALGACAGAWAQPYDAADRERRDRNREELMARYGEPGSSRTATTAHHESSMHHASNEVRAETHSAAEATRHFTHRQAEKMRHFGEKQNQKYSHTSSPRQDAYSHGPQ